MGQKALVLAVLLPLAACSGGGSDNGSNPVTGGSSGTDGTQNPTPNNSITRYETRDDNGSGYAEGFVYDSGSDTFTVDNLAFDGDNTYTAEDDAAVVANIPYAVYENAATFVDPDSGVPINQFPHKVIYGRSTNTDSDGNPVTEFAIVRTGAYVGYGFGGFVYQRTGGVTLPTEGQAVYTGDYAALRDFQNSGGLEYATGDMEIIIDFNDFNEGDAVQGTVYNRRIFDSAGNDITADMLAALEAEYGGTYAALPSLTFSITPDALSAAGEIQGSLGSNIVNGDGATVAFESGSYYAVVAGENADEIVGVIVVEADDPRAEGVTVRETGGFILYRP